jgi:hypothetical protein
MEQPSELRIWFAMPKTAEQLQEDISFLKGLCEEILLSKVDFRIEIYANRHPIQQDNS